MASRGRSRRKLKEPSRIEAAFDAMRVFGFHKNLVRQTVAQLLEFLFQVYGDEGWYFFEADSYSVLLDALIEKQQSEDPIKGDSSQGVAEDSNHTNASAYGPSNETLLSTCSKEVADDAMQTDEALGSVQIDKALGTSLQNIESDRDNFSAPPAKWEGNARKDIGLDLTAEKNVTEVNDKASCMMSKLIHSPPGERFPVRTRRPCYGWITSDDDDDNDEDLVELTPAPLPDCLANFFNGRGGQGKRKTRWDVRSEDL